MPYLIVFILSTLFGIVRFVFHVAWSILCIACRLFVKIWRVTIGRLLGMLSHAICAEIDRNLKFHQNPDVRITPDKPFTWVWNRNPEYYHMYDNYVYDPSKELEKA